MRVTIEKKSLSTENKVTSHCAVKRKAISKAFYGT